jgi:ubiquinol-cytochrome c reductase cytochrome b subunit
VVPGFVVALFFSIPLLDKLLPPRAAHGAALLITGGTFAGMVGLTFAAVRSDAAPSPARVAEALAKSSRGESLTPEERDRLRAHEFNRKRRRADDQSRRALELAAQHGIPPGGPLELPRNDPMTQGPILFAAHCASCHRYFGHDGLGVVPSEPATSSDLGGFGSRAWIRGLLENPMDDRYFGRMRNPEGEPAHTRMEKWTRETLEANESDQDQAALSANFTVVARYLEMEGVAPGRWVEAAEPTSPEGRRPSTFPASLPDEALILAGRKFFMEVCHECHAYDGKRRGTTRAPDLFGYGSPVWIMQMIADPAHPSRYGAGGREPARMPPFQDRLTEQERRMIAEWLHVTARPSFAEGMAAAGS